MLGKRSEQVVHRDLGGAYLSENGFGSYLYKRPHMQHPKGAQILLEEV